MSSEKEFRPPGPIPLKKRLADDGRTHVWLIDEISIRLERNIGDDHFSRVINGRRPVPKDWVLPVAEILGINVDEARYLLGLTEVTAEV